jgi:hypothetical protein
MKRILLTTTVIAAIVGGGLALAQSPAPSADDHAAHHPTKAPKAGASGEQSGAGQTGTGNGMMGNGTMGGGMCGMVMGAANTKVDVKKMDKGVTITMTSSDAATVARLQKMAEAMRLVHEAMTP